MESTFSFSRDGKQVMTCEEQIGNFSQYVHLVEISDHSLELGFEGVPAV